MKKEEWISERVAKMKELSFLQGLTDVQIDWIASMFESAWDRGATEGRHDLFEYLNKDRSVD